MAIEQRVIHYKTSGIAKPSPENIEFGELAIQYNNLEPKLYIKKANGEIAEFLDKSGIEVLIKNSDITASGDFYVSATAKDNHVTIKSRVSTDIPGTTEIGYIADASAVSTAITAEQERAMAAEKEISDKIIKINEGTITGATAGDDWIRVETIDKIGLRISHNQQVNDVTIDLTGATKEAKNLEDVTVNVVTAVTMDERGHLISIATETINAKSTYQYIHPSYNQFSLDFYKVQVDNLGHVSNVVPVNSADIINTLGYTPYDSANPENYITTAATVAKAERANVASSAENVPWANTNHPDTYEGYGLKIQGDGALISADLGLVDKAVYNLSLATGTVEDGQDVIAIASDVKKYINTIITGAVTYKGVTGDTPANPTQAGELYIANKAFTLAASSSTIHESVEVESGDYLISREAGSLYVWDTIQRNMTGAVTSKDDLIDDGLDAAQEADKRSPKLIVGALPATETGQEIKLLNQTIGSPKQPVYLSGGRLVAAESYLNTEVDEADHVSHTETFKGYTATGTSAPFEILSEYNGSKDVKISYGTRGVAGYPSMTATTADDKTVVVVDVNIIDCGEY